VVPGAGSWAERSPAYAMLHRPMWDPSWIRPGEGTHVPAGIEDDRPGIRISYVPADAAEADPSSLVRLSSHRLVALSEFRSRR
jgi:beta-1,2-mannobiose phosphorylase / 1,2-beta-oligomannan phosphorylase